MQNNTFGRVIKSLAVAGLGLLGASSAQAGFTAVNTTTVTVPGHELGHAAILSHAYGGSFAADGVNYTNGTITAQRLEDFTSVGGMTSLLASSASTPGVECDQSWANGTVSARAIARYAGFEQAFGYVEQGPNGGVYNELFTVTGSGLDVAGSAFGVDLANKIVQFSRGGGGEFFTSLDTANIGGHDQMVSYKLTGPNGLVKYLLFFEDSAPYQDSDWDFNDLAVELSVGPGAHAIPLPPAAWAGLTVLAGGLMTRKRLVGLLK